MKMFFVSISIDDDVFRVVLSAPSIDEVQAVADKLYPGCEQIDPWYVQEVDLLAVNAEE